MDLALYVILSVHLNRFGAALALGSPPVRLAAGHRSIDDVEEHFVSSQDSLSLFRTLNNLP